MPVLPIDIQTLIGHLTDVGRGEQVRQDAPVQQQAEAARLVAEKERQRDRTVQEAEGRHGEETKVRDQKGKRPGGDAGPGGRRRRGAENAGERRRDIPEPGKGTIIDVRQ